MGIELASSFLQETRLCNAPSRQITALKLFLDGVTTDLVPVQGTAVGRAIEACAQGLIRIACVKDGRGFTDGENHEDTVAMAVEALGMGVEVHTVGMGNTSGRPSRSTTGSGGAGIQNDSDGNPIVTALDDATLIQVAEADNGTYVQAGKGFVNIAPILGAMNALNQTETSTVAYTDFTHHFHWFFLVALLFILVEAVLNLTFKPRMA